MSNFKFLKYLNQGQQKFIGRTVLVKNGKVEEAFRVLNRILAQESILFNYRNNKYYEKPFQVRKRVNFELAKSLYNTDMNRKIEIVTRRNRENPWIGCD